jgi:arabinan endo-1,5-alpha-L-arabinosidase
MIRRGAALATALLVAGLLAVPATATATAATGGGGTAPSRASGASSHGHPATKVGSYTNPLSLALPSTGTAASKKAAVTTAASCADPTVIHGQTKGDKNWYLYCTSDALTETEKDAAGDLVIHNVPMFRSTDLVHWTYQGDALPTRPSWVAASGGLWAPDVVFAGGQYRLYYAASDTVSGGSAVGVATSSSPLGPWTDAGAPVVPPQETTGDKRWEFDPDVITVGSKSYVYFGSYFGGIHARELSTDGLSSVASTETSIAIDNRYEGALIVKHAGWYYFLGSATNCCAGPLTGYSVFAARSRSPLGPFVDRDGVSILAGRVGGTPVLSQNGNRWVGVGHNTVLTDYAGQDWTIYHAVDRTDPYYTSDVGYTKRPALLDPLDWKSGWPVVRGGSGPSDSEVPAPTAQPGQKAAYHAKFVANAKPGRTIAALSDSFAGTALSSRWTWVRQPAASEYSVAGGSLSWSTQAADLHPPAEPLASVLTEPAPRGDFVVETKVSTTVPAEGCCQNYVQGGLVIYGDDGNYVKLASASIWNTRQTEFGKNVTPVADGYPTYGNGVVGPVGESTWLRIVKKSGAKLDRYTAYTSIDGHTWDKGGTWTHALGSKAKIGLVSMGGSGFTSTFEYVRVSTVRG